MSVAIVERHLFGGTCVNTGCIPTKAMVASAYAAHMARRASDYGVVVDGGVRVDMKRVKARKDAISEKSRTGVEQWLRGMERCDVYTGHARFRAAHEVAVGDQILAPTASSSTSADAHQCRRCPASITVPFLTNSSMMALDTVPPHLLIVGGSYVGLEFGQMFRRFGSEVTIIEMGPRLVQREDEEISSAIQDVLTGEGINLRLNAKCIQHQRAVGRSLPRMSIATAGSPSVAGTHLLLAVGRQPNTDDLGLEAAGVSRDERGYIVVNDRLETERAGHLGPGRLQRQGRVHPHVLQRLRDRRVEPARRRQSRRVRPNPRLRALHRPAARPRGHDRDRGPEERTMRCWSGGGP